MRKRIVILLSMSLCCMTIFAQTSRDAIWQEFQERNISETGTRYIVPTHYRTLSMDRGEMRQLLSTAPMQYSGNTIELSLPKPDGTWGSFRVEESPVMEKALAAKYPEIRTYRGYGESDPTAYARFDVTPAGFHAMVLSTEGTYYIDPYFFENPNDIYVSYYRKDYPYNRDDPWNCHTREEDFGIELPDLGDRANLGTGEIPTGTEMLNYRCAIAATGEYSTFHGGTIPSALAAIVVALNRVNVVYNHDVALHMNLIANNDQIIYLDRLTDPYTNNNGIAMLGENQTNITNVIGAANYDIGHVFSTGGGGVATLGSPCVNSIKARGVTGLPSPVGDVFYIDFVAHEMGHQWAGRHTFNGSTGNCQGGNRSPGAAYEPGSGSTIQAYAGICGGENLQNTSDAYFHSYSMIEIINFTRNNAGNTCSVSDPIVGNTPPDNLNPGSPVTLPINTPFTLVGSATDSETRGFNGGGQTLLYNFEQFDRGTVAPPNTDNGTRPFIRSFFYSETPERTIPRWSDLLNGTTTFGESLPTTTRTLSFRMTVRDGVGGTNTSLVQHMTDDTAGPFLVTALDGGGTFDGNEMVNITWDVANTDNGNVNCQTVDIFVSLDGGATFSELVADDTPNDGSEMIAMPNADTTTGRIMVKAAANLFFDINNTNFTIEAIPAVCPTEYESWLGSSSEGGFIDTNGNGIVDIADLISCLPAP